MGFDREMQESQIKLSGPFSEGTYFYLTIPFVMLQNLGMACLKIDFSNSQNGHANFVGPEIV